MLRLPIPIILATIVVSGVAVVYFYITVISNPTQGAWTDQGNGTVFTYTVPAGGWVILGVFSGSSIVVQSNVTMDVRYDRVSAVAFSNQPMPEGLYTIDTLSLRIHSTGHISLNTNIGWCHAGSSTTLSNGMVMYYPNYGAVGATCSCIWPPPSYVIDSWGWITVSGCTALGSYSATSVMAHTITPPIYSNVYGIGSQVYYLYLRPTYLIWVRPSASAQITVIVNP